VYESKNNIYFGKITDYLCIISQMNETREISVKSQLGTDILVRELRKDVFILDK